MAFSKELEEVIEAALADGVITDKERAVLHKKALLEGVDPDELDIVIEGRLSKMKREEDWLKPAPPASEKRGNIVKCPNCGAPIQAGTTKCEECGYVFTNVKATQSVSKLFDEIQKITSTESDKDTRNERINIAINNFPVPTAKEDILEFLYMGIPSSKKRGNFINCNPALSGFLLGTLVIVVIAFVWAGTSVGSKDFENDTFSDLLGMSLLTTLIFTWWLPLVLMYVFNKVLKAKSLELFDHNARAATWRNKSSQVIAKARIAMAGDPDLAKVEAMAKQIGL